MAEENKVERCPICGQDMGIGLGETARERKKRHLGIVASNSIVMEEHEESLREMREEDSDDRKDKKG